MVCTACCFQLQGNLLAAESSMKPHASQGLLPAVNLQLFSMAGLCTGPKFEHAVLKFK